MAGGVARIAAAVVVAGLVCAGWMEGGPRVRVGYGNARPMAYQAQGGRPEGFAVEATEAAAKRAGVELEWVLVGPPPVDQQLGRGDFDLLVTGVPNAERRAKFWVSEPWWRTEMMAVVLVGSEVQRERELDGRRLAVPAAGVPLVTAAFPASERVVRRSAREAVESACTGEADGAVIAAVFLRDLLFQMPKPCQGQRLRSVDVTATMDYSLVARRERRAEAERIREGLDEITVDGTLARLAEKYPPVSTKQAMQLNELMKSQYDRRLARRSNAFVSGTLALAVLFILWQFRSRRRLLRANAELRTTQEALEQSEGRFRNLVETSFDGIWEVDLAGRHTYASRRVEELLGRPEAEILGKTPFEMMPAEEALRVRAAFEAVVAEARPFVALECTFLRSDGRQVVLETSGAPVFDEAGQLVGYRGMGRDVTERKQAQEELRRIVANSPALLYALKVEPERAALGWVSESIEALTGYSATEVQAPGWWFEAIHPEDRAEVFRRNPAPYDVEHQVLHFRVRHKDGHYIRVRDEKRLLRGEGGRPAEVIGLWTDETRVLELEEQLRQSQKMEAIGNLAGGVAHDFNNLLTVINGYALILKEKGGSEYAEGLEQILKAGERAADLVKRLLAFSRKQVLQPRPVRVSEAVRGVEPMLRRMVGEDVELVVRGMAAGDWVVADRLQLEQVLMNLVVNGRDAMPGGGRIEIETRAGEGGVELMVRDHGVGMDEETQRRIFEPFFTTKAAEKGTGLGLAMVEGIVKQSGGRLRLESIVGEGTTFVVWLPGGAEPEEEQTVRVAKREAAAGELVLVVEDQASVRDFVVRALELSGFRVRAAGTAAEALEWGLEGVDGILTDVVMPQMNGWDFAERVRALRPEMPVVFMSGYPEPGARGGLPAGIELLRKPFSPDELVAAMRRAIGGRRRGGRVLVADAEPAVTGLLCLALLQAGFEATGVCAGGEVEAELGECGAEVVVSSLLLPGMNGRATIERMRAVRPGVAVVALASELVEGGAQPDAVLNKLMEPQELVEVVERLLAGVR